MSHPLLITSTSSASEDQDTDDEDLPTLEKTGAKKRYLDVFLFPKAPLKKGIVEDAVTFSTNSSLLALGIIFQR
jgi:hypothetical protein